MIKRPTNIKRLGYFHKEKIALLKSIQDLKLLYKVRLLNQENRLLNVKKTK